MNRATEPAADPQAAAAPSATCTGTPKTFVARTVLGKRLWLLRQKIVASGAPLLSWEQIEHELAERRGDRVAESDK